jgi:hypothetical protein
MLFKDWTAIAPDVLRCEKAEIIQAGTARQRAASGKPLASSRDSPYEQAVCSLLLQQRQMLRFGVTPAPTKRTEGAF